jgi:broad specificity phosphatase PhoE
LTRLIIIRHGQTAWNEGEGERLRGRADLELDEIGLRQARAAATRMALWRVTAVYSSPLRRAVTTAEILAESLRLKAQTLEGLIDIDYGSWQGLSLKEAEANDPDLYRLWLQRPHLATFPGGEDLEQVRERVNSSVEILVPRHLGQTVVLVSHKVVCKVLLCSLLGLDNSHFWQIQQGLCAISLVEIENDVPVMLLLNDTCHLRDVG